jgi:hypothetical protein
LKKNNSDLKRRKKEMRFVIFSGESRWGVLRQIAERQEPTNAISCAREAFERSSGPLIVKVFDKQTGRELFCLIRPSIALIPN